MAMIHLPDNVENANTTKKKVSSKNLDKSYNGPSCMPFQVTYFVQMLIGKKQESTERDFQASIIHKEFAFSFWCLTQWPLARDRNAWKSVIHMPESILGYWSTLITIARNSFSFCSSTVLSLMLSFTSRLPQLAWEWKALLYCSNI